ncbi:hypothetical protein MRX96_002489 [Rhipicephalus microplus]
MQQPSERAVETPTPTAPALERASTNSSDANRAAKRRAADDPPGRARSPVVIGGPAQNEKRRERERAVRAAKRAQRESQNRVRSSGNGGAAKAAKIRSGAGAVAMA